MNILRVQQRAAEIPKIPVPDPDYPIEIIVKEIRNRKLLLFDNGAAVMKSTHHYIRLSADECEAFIVALLPTEIQESIQSPQIREIIRRLRFIPQLQINLQSEFWKAQRYVNLKSGIYDIERQELVYDRNTFVFDYCIDVEYQARSKLEDAPNFKRFVETSIGLDQLECLLRVLGYCLSSLTKGRKAFIFYGRGRTGKSTILNVLEAVIGDGLVSHESYHAMSGERAKAHYHGKRVNISRETSTKVNKHEDSFKSLISCEFTTGSEKYEKARDFAATLSFIFAGNTDLEFGVLDDAILDRLVYLMFTREIPEADIDLDLEQKLLTEKDVIFSLALDSLKGLITDKYDFKMSPAAEAHIQRRRFSIHSPESFLDEKCSLSDGGRVSKVALYTIVNNFLDVL